MDYFCDICGKQIIGTMYGHGDGSGGRFAHPICFKMEQLDYWREASQRYRDALYSYRGCGEPLDSFVCYDATARELTRLWKEAQKEAEEQVCALISYRDLA